MPKSSYAFRVEKAIPFGIQQQPREVDDSIQVAASRGQIKLLSWYLGSENSPSADVPAAKRAVAIALRLERACKAGGDWTDASIICLQGVDDDLLSEVLKQDWVNSNFKFAPNPGLYDYASDTGNTVILVSSSASITTEGAQATLLSDSQYDKLKALVVDVVCPNGQILSIASVHVLPNLEQNLAFRQLQGVRQALKTSNCEEGRAGWLITGNEYGILGEFLRDTVTYEGSAGTQVVHEKMEHISFDVKGQFGKNARVEGELLSNFTGTCMVIISE